MSTPDVVIAIVTYCSVDDIARCLESVAANTTCEYRIVVVDNASTDGTADLVAAHFPEVELIRSPTNLGFAGGVNLAAAAVDGRHILLLNPDTELRSPAVDTLLQAAKQFPEHMIYGGVTVGLDGRPDGLSAWDLPTLSSLVSFAFGISSIRLGKRGDKAARSSRDRSEEPIEVEAVSGCFQLIDSELWHRLGGLDEKYFLYGEDADWAIRARGAGARPLLVPSAEIMHEVGASSSSDDKRVMVMRGKATVLISHWSRSRARIGVGLLLLGTALRGPVANPVRRVFRRPAETSWAATWVRRREWSSGW